MHKDNKQCAIFFAQVGHDLRQPLQALMIYLDLFDTNSFSPKQKVLWQKIVKSAGSLKMMLTNVLDFSKVEFGGIKACKHNVNMGILLSDLGQEYVTVAEVKNLDFEYFVCNCFVKTDAVLLERILRNLLSNAFKFAKKKVSMVCKEYTDKIIISVTDDGVGIHQDDMPHIFEEFYQGKNLQVYNNDGTGLGLAIVKKIADILNIKIKVNSTFNEGSVFAITLQKK